MDESFTEFMGIARRLLKLAVEIRKAHPHRPYCPECDIGMERIQTPGARELWVCDECASIWECISREGSVERRVDNERA